MRQIHRCHAIFHGKPAGRDGCSYPLPVFLHRGIRQPDDEHLGCAASIVGLDLDLDGIDADEGG